MPSGPPPPRWRVVERGLRLEVIDTWAAGGQPARASRAGRATPAVAPTKDPWAKAADSTPAYRAIAKLVTLGATDAQRRPLLTTAAWYDRKAPRTFALDEAGVRRLGRGVALTLGALVVLFVALGWFALGAPVIAWAIVSQQGKGWTTRWLDGLEDPQA